MMHPTRTAGATVWLTGLPSSGKTTIAELVAAEFAERGARTQVLDGDVLRTHLCADLGFSAQDRRTNVMRAGVLAELLARNGVLTFVPVIAPYADSRAAVRELHANHGTPFVEAYVDTPTEVCARRDVKGLYHRQRTGRLTGLTGVDDPYEIPIAPDLVVPTRDRAPRASAQLVLDDMARRGLLDGLLMTVRS